MSRFQAHWETDRFFVTSGVQFVQQDRGLFHFHRAAFSPNLKGKVGSTLVKTTVLRINLNIDGTPITSKTHIHPSHSQNISSINLVFIFRCFSSPINPVYTSRVDFSS